MCLSTNFNEVADVSECAVNTANEDDLVCIGILCDIDLTTGIFRNNDLDGDLKLLYGGCEFNASLGTEELGCPVEIFYRLAIGEGLSPDVNEPAQLLWITNEFQNDPQDNNRLIEKSPYGRFQQGNPTIFSNSNPIQVDDPDVDVKNIEIVLSVVADASLLGIPDLLESFPGDDHFFFRDGCFFNGCNSQQNDEAKLIGLSSLVNNALSELTFTYTGTDNTDIIMSIAVTVPFRVIGALAPEISTIRLQVGEEDENETVRFSFGSPQFIAIAAVVLIIILMCIISVCRASGRCANSGVKLGRQAARRMGRKDIQRGREDSDDFGNLDKALQGEINKKAYEMRSATQLVICLNALCPCLCSLDELKKEELAGELDVKMKEETMLEKYDKKLHHKILAKKMPRRASIDEEIDYDIADGEDLMNWERYSAMKDDKEVTYYYNTVTDKSQWHSPYPKKNIRKGTQKQAGKHHEGNHQAGKQHGEKRLAPRPPKMPKSARNGGGAAIHSHRGGQSDRSRAHPPNKPKHKPGLDDIDISL